MNHSLLCVSAIFIPQLWYVTFLSLSVSSPVKVGISGGQGCLWFIAMPSVSSNNTASGQTCCGCLPHLLHDLLVVSHSTKSLRGINSPFEVGTIISYFTDEETEAQKVKITCSVKRARKWGAGIIYKPRLPDSRTSHHDLWANKQLNIVSQALNLSQV